MRRSWIFGLCLALAASPALADGVARPSTPPPPAAETPSPDMPQPGSSQPGSSQPASPPSVPLTPPASQAQPSRPRGFVEPAPRSRFVEPEALSRGVTRETLSQETTPAQPELRGSIDRARPQKRERTKQTPKITK